MDSVTNKPCTGHALTGPKSPYVCSLGRRGLHSDFWVVRFFVVVVAWVLAFWDRVLYCHPGWLEMCCVDKVGLKFVAILFPQAKNRKLKKGYRDSSSAMGPCQQCWQLQFNPQNLLSRRKKPAPVSCPLTSTSTLWHTDRHTHTHMHTQRNFRK